MEELCKAIPGTRTAALLWLTDSEWDLLVLDRYASGVTNQKVPGQLANLFVPKGGDWPSVLAKCAPVRSWAQQHGFATGHAVVPVAAPDPIGYVQLWSDVELGAADLRKFDPLCEAFAAFLKQGRISRRLHALADIQEGGQGATSVRDWLTTAAKVALRNTSGSVCLVFREMTGGGFRADAIATVKESEVKESEIVLLDPAAAELEAMGVSVIKRVAQIGEARRVPRLSVSAMRKRAFDAEEHDEKLGAKVATEILHEDILSVLIAPVMFENHALAVIVLLNKRSASHLSAVFSETDKIMLQSVCQYLSGLLPSTVMNEAVRAIGELVSPRMLKLEDERRKLFEVIEKAIPGVTGAALIREQPRSKTPKLELLGGILSTSDHHLMLSRTDEHVKVPGATSKSGVEHFLYTTRIESEALDSRCHLTIESTRDFLISFERGVLAFFTKELLHPLLLEQNLDSLMELRHALRSGLTGVVGYVNEAMGCYELYRDLHYAPSLLSVARFRKALERARFASEKTNQLLEESRLTLGLISSASLRVGAFTLSKVIKRVLDVLRPFAKERRIELMFNNAMPDDLDRVTIDRLLTEMMIFNLVDNAIKYSHRDRNVLVHLSPSRGDWVIQVTDYGVAVRTEDSVAIFEPFVRRPTGHRSDSRPGTGLGLPVAKRIAEAHGGKITVKSRFAGDDVSETTFSIRIPRVLPRESRE